MTPKTNDLKHYTQLCFDVYFLSTFSPFRALIKGIHCSLLSTCLINVIMPWINRQKFEKFMQDNHNMQLMRKRQEEIVMN